MYDSLLTAAKDSMITTKKILSCTSITRKNTIVKKNSSASAGISPSIESYSVLVHSSRVELSYTDSRAKPLLRYKKTRKVGGGRRERVRERGVRGRGKG